MKSFCNPVKHFCRNTLNVSVLIPIDRSLMQANSLCEICTADILFFSFQNDAVFYKHKYGLSA